MSLDSTNNAIQGVTSTEFIEEIQSETRAGFGFVPLIGSGLSAASGALMGVEFAGYLAHAVNKVVGNSTGPSWDIRNSGWPPLPSPLVCFNSSAMRSAGDAFQRWP